MGTPSSTRCWRPRTATRTSHRAHPATRDRLYSCLETTQTDCEVARADGSAVCASGSRGTTVTLNWDTVPTGGGLGRAVWQRRTQGGDEASGPMQFPTSLTAIPRGVSNIALATDTDGVPRSGCTSMLQHSWSSCVRNSRKSAHSGLARQQHPERSEWGGRASFIPIACGLYRGSKDGE
jgi:hypothetical protein